MVAATQIAFADQFKKGQLGLSDHDYYDPYVAPYARQKFAQASGEAAPMRRGAKLRQGQLVAAQFGGQPTSMGEAATEKWHPLSERPCERPFRGPRWRLMSSAQPR